MTKAKKSPKKKTQKRKPKKKKAQLEFIRRYSNGADGAVLSPLLPQINPASKLAQRR